MKRNAWRGGSMIWTALLLLLLPLALVLLVNGVRLAETIAVGRTITTAACQAAADASLERRLYEHTAQERLDPHNARYVATAQFTKVITPLYRKGIVGRVRFTLRVQGQAVICSVRILYRPWLLQGISEPNYWLTVESVVSQIQVNQH